MRIADKKKAPEIYRTMFSYYLWGGGILGFFIIIFSPEIFAIFIDAEYISAARITFIGVISTYLQGIFNLINLIFYAKQRAGNIAGAVIAGALLNIGLNYFLIPVYDNIGAGFASVIAYLVIVFINYIAAQKRYHPDYKIGYLLIILPVLGLAVILVNILPFNLPVIIIKVSSSLIFSGLFYYFLQRTGEWQKLKLLISKD
jgi:O-antigen/teichoic acid export membrane protein